jgi:hypothetical protein
LNILRLANRSNIATTGFIAFAFLNLDAVSLPTTSLLKPLYDDFLVQTYKR